MLSGGIFQKPKAILIATFEKFKRRTYMLLFVSLAVVIICQGFFTTIGTYTLQVSNGIESFCYKVIVQ